MSLATAGLEPLRPISLARGIKALDKRSRKASMGWFFKARTVEGGFRCHCRPLGQIGYLLYLDYGVVYAALRTQV